MTRIVLEPRPSPLTRATWANPYPVYADLRKESPAFLLGPGPNGTPLALWGIFTYDQVYGALKDHTTFAANPVLPSLLGLDPPRHTRMRALVNRAFTPRRVAELRPQVAALIDELLDRIDPDGVEFVDAYTVPLPVRVIARLLGVPEDEYPTFKRWSDLSVSFVTATPEERARNRAEMDAYFRRVAQERRTAGAADLISTLVAAELDGERLSEAELLSFCALLLVAGNETTTNLLSNLLNRLAERPDLWQQLRADRSLVGPAIEESLRHESPVQFLLRRTTRDVAVDGAVIPAGSFVNVFYGRRAAGRGRGGTATRARDRGGRPSAPGGAERGSSRSASARGGGRRSRRAPPRSAARRRRRAAGR